MPTGKKIEMSFGNKIKKILSKNGYNYRVRIFPRQDKILKNGKRLIQEYEKVVIYAGRSIGVSASKRSKRLNKTEPVKHTLFSDLWEENEKKFGGQEQELLKIMENWKFQETERDKL